MKGNQSGEFKRVLADREARRELRRVISKGEGGGRITVGPSERGDGKVTYNVKTSKTHDLARTHSSGSASRGGGRGERRVK